MSETEENGDSVCGTGAPWANARNCKMNAGSEWSCIDTKTPSPRLPASSNHPWNTLQHHFIGILAGELVAICIAAENGNLSAVRIIVRFLLEIAGDIADDVGGSELIVEIVMDHVRGQINARHNLPADGEIFFGNVATEIALDQRVAVHRTVIEGSRRTRRSHAFLHPVAIAIVNVTVSAIVHAYKAVLGVVGAMVVPSKVMLPAASYWKEQPVSWF